MSTRLAEPEPLHMKFPHSIAGSLPIEGEKEREIRFEECVSAIAPAILANVVLSSWTRIRTKVSGGVFVPYFDLMESGGALLTWDRGAHHLDVEIFPDARLDFFYLNRETNEAWDVEISREEYLPKPVIACLEYFRVSA